MKYYAYGNEVKRVDGRETIATATSHLYALAIATALNAVNAIEASAR